MKREARPGYPASRRLWIEDLGLIPKFGRYRLHCKICKADFDSKLHAITSHEDTAKHEAAEAQAAAAEAKKQRGLFFFGVESLQLQAAKQLQE